MTFLETVDGELVAGRPFGQPLPGEDRWTGWLQPWAFRCDKCGRTLPYGAVLSEFERRISNDEARQFRSNARAEGTPEDPVHACGYCEGDDAWDRDWWAHDSQPWIERIRARDPKRAEEVERRWRAQRAARARLDAQRPIAAEDDRAMLNCPMRAPWVRGLTRAECGRLRICYQCGGELPGKRQHWCSDACVRRWAENHEWSAASGAALRRDRRRCVRCGSTSAPEVNHRRPRNGRGYHQGCHHHLKLLETLCHECHVAETNAQAARRRGAA